MTAARRSYRDVLRSRDRHDPFTGLPVWPIGFADRPKRTAADVEAQG